MWEKKKGEKNFCKEKPTAGGKARRRADRGRGWKIIKSSRGGTGRSGVY